MGVLQRFEQRLDRLVNGAFAKAFRSEVQPVEIASALQRELDDKAAVLERGRTVVPNLLTVQLGDADHDRLAPYAEPLSRELAAMVRDHAQNQNYEPMGPIEVTFERESGLDTGVFRVSSAGRAGVTAQPRSSSAAQAAAAPEASATMSAPPAADAHPRIVVNDTAYPLVQNTTAIGRGSDVDIRIDDPGISRRHAEFRVHADGRTISVVDLASTNGTFIKNQRIGEHVLSDGDVIGVGSTSIVFRTG